MYKGRRSKEWTHGPNCIFTIFTMLQYSIVFLLADPRPHQQLQEVTGPTLNCWTDLKIQWQLVKLDSFLNSCMHFSVTEEVLDPVWNFPTKGFFFFQTSNSFFLFFFLNPFQNLKPEFYLLGLDHYVLEQIVLKQLNEPVFNHSLKYKLGKS